MNNSLKKYRVFWPVVFLSPFVICFFLFNLYPILYSFYMSTLDWAGYNEKVYVGFKNFISIFTKDKLFWKSVLNTLKIGLSGFPIALVLGLIFAALLCKFSSIYYDAGGDRYDLHLYF